MANEEELFAEFVRQTASIPWGELQRYFAAGKVIVVDESIDLVRAACWAATDNHAEIQSALKDGHVFQPTDEQAAQWLLDDVTMWAVVVAPWVFVQSEEDRLKNQKK